MLKALGLEHLAETLDCLELRAKGTRLRAFGTKKESIQLANIVRFAPYYHGLALGDDKPPAPTPAAKRTTTHNTTPATRTTTLATAHATPATTLPIVATGSTNSLSRRTAFRTWRRWPIRNYFGTPEPLPCLAQRQSVESQPEVRLQRQFLV